jgi:hypothetical protein
LIVDFELASKPVVSDPIKDTNTFLGGDVEVSIMDAGLDHENNM